MNTPTKEEFNKAEALISHLYYRFSTNENHTITLSETEVEELRRATATLHNFMNFINSNLR